MVFCTISTTIFHSLMAEILFSPTFHCKLVSNPSSDYCTFYSLFLGKIQQINRTNMFKASSREMFFFFLVVFTRTYQQTWLLCMRLHVECNNVHNPRKESLQHLCPRKLITVVRCRKAIYRITRRLHICAGQPCVTCCAPLNMHGQQGPQHLKIIERNQLL